MPDNHTPRLEITPERALVDAPLAVRLTGLPPGQRVTLRAQVHDDAGRPWRSHATFISDSAGGLDLAAARPVEGTWETADPLGLIWSAQPPSDEALSIAPFGAKLAPIRVDVEAEVDGRVVAAKRIERLPVAPGVTRMPVRERGLVGTLFLPPGEGPFPGVIVVGGSGGGLSELSAALLASHGFATLALAYFGIEPLPLDLIDIPLEYFETAIDWLLEQPGVRRGGVGFIGTSRGGELALLVGSTFPRVKAVVGYVPSSVVHGGIGRGEPDLNAPPKPAWTYRGEPVPFLGRNRPPRPAPESTHGQAAPEPGGTRLTPMFLQAMEDAEGVEAATIPVERIQGPVLLISGEDDQMWPSAMFARRVMDRLTRLRHPYPDEHRAYPGAGHTIGVPHLPATVTRSVHPVRRQVFAYGGNARDNAAARADSWPRVLVFLRAALTGAGAPG